MPILDARTLDFFSRSPEQTRRLGMRLGALLQQGDLVCLSGDLGAGKTQLVKGLARGLGIERRVHSPTFALVNVYEGGRLMLCHLDLYRLETQEQIFSAGLEEFLEPSGVAVIEWAERWFGGNYEPAPLPRFRRVRIEATGETERRIEYEDLGD